MVSAQLADVGLQGSAHRYGELCVHAVLDVRRSFTRPELEHAVRATITSFPVLGSIYEVHFFRDRWVQARAPISEMVHFGIEKDLESDTRSWTDRWLNPTREPPFRVVCLPKDQGCRLIFSISHLAADGAGMAAVGHVFAAFLYGMEPRLPVESRRDLRRALDGLGLQHIPVLARDLAVSVVQPWRVWTAGPRNRPFPADSLQKSSSRMMILEKSTLEALQARCGKRVRINDLLVAIVGMVSAKRTSYGPVSVLYTMDLRRFSRKPHLSATNASSILTTVVPREATQNLADAVEAVEAETKRHRESLAGPAMLLLPMLLAGSAPHAFVRRLLPAIHPILVELPTSRGFIFTNVGKIDQGLGPLAADIEHIRVVGPSLRGISTPAIIAFGLNDRVHLELYAPPGLSEAALDELENELREVIGMERHG
jgi:NRPS condensation-like uncharacterized protein